MMTLSCMFLAFFFYACTKLDSISFVQGYRQTGVGAHGRTRKRSSLQIDVQVRVYQREARVRFLFSVASPCSISINLHRLRFARDARWSETGDRYIIKLFRDYVFHQVDEHGNPILDLSHVLTCLNKVCHLSAHVVQPFQTLIYLHQLDAGTDEKLMLVARDEQSCLVVSYKDIKTCVSNAFEYAFFSCCLVHPTRLAHVLLQGTCTRDNC